jgi:hypothetical protein
MRRYGILLAPPDRGGIDVRQETPVRRVILAFAALAVIGGATAATAAPPPIVGVTHNPDGSICVTVSYQVPHCTPATGDIIR